MSIYRIQQCIAALAALVILATIMFSVIGYSFASRQNLSLVISAVHFGCGLFSVYLLYRVNTETTME